MGTGPIALFDKSFIQSLSQDEAVWFDHFFLCNIAPPFLIETLADLKQKPKKGRTAPQVVQNIAEKTPEHGCPGVNTFHRQAATGSLLGYKIPMTGQAMISSGKRVNVDGKTSTIVERTPEAEAFSRWQDGKFYEVEERVAARWRESLETSPDVATAIKWINGAGLKFGACKTREDVKRVIDEAIGGSVPTQTLFNLLLILQDIGEPALSQGRARLEKMKFVAMRWFAPYAAHVLSVDLFMYACMSLGLISVADPHTKTDFSYLYYLPFCMLFVSSDNVHKNCVPLFLRADQRFVWGPDLKAALKEINAHYSATVSEADKEQGIFHFAMRPPATAGTLVADLWRAMLRPGVMDDPPKAPSSQVDPEKHKEVISELNSLVEKAKAAPEISGSDASEDDSLMIQRKVRGQRGSWRILSKKAMEDE